MNIIKRTDLAKKIGVCSDSIKKLTEEDGLPKPIKIGKVSGWIVEEVDEWLATKIQERDALIASSEVNSINGGEFPPSLGLDSEVVS